MMDALHFSFSWWKTIYWAIGFFGIAGTIALVVFAPAALRVIIGAVGRLFSFVLSYRVGCALLAAILAAVAADFWRHDHEDKKHAAELAAFEQAQTERDQRIRTETRDAVRTEVANEALANAMEVKEVKEFTDALPPVPHTGNPFRVGDAAGRLRQIYGQPEGQSRRVAGVPKARRTGRRAKN